MKRKNSLLVTILLIYALVVKRLKLYEVGVNIFVDQLNVQGLLENKQKYIQTSSIEGQSGKLHVLVGAKVVA